MRNKYIMNLHIFDTDVNIIDRSGAESLIPVQESNEIMDDFIRRVFEKTDKEEMARLVNYIYQQYDLAKRELEKIRESQKKAKKATDEKD